MTLRAAQGRSRQWLQVNETMVIECELRGELS
jgi:hypothetical protein